MQEMRDLQDNHYTGDVRVQKAVGRIIIMQKMQDMQEMQDLQDSHYTGDARHYAG